MKKPALIQSLKEEYGLELEPFDGELEELMRYRWQNHFAQDAAGQVIGLNLRSNKLTDKIFKTLGQAPALQALNLSENELREVTVPEAWVGLRFLDLSENKNLSRLEFRTPHTARLEWLDLNECALEKLEVPSFLFLKKLDVSRNRLVELSFRGDCGKLEMLDASKNQLTAFEVPGSFISLKYLYLNDNQIENLRFKWDMEALVILHLRNNKLEYLTLPERLLHSPKMQALYLHGNPLAALPKEVISEDEDASSWTAVRAFLLNLERGRRINDRVKIILVGNGRVGKTSLLNRLKNRPFNQEEPYTHGIALDQLTADDLGEPLRTGSLQAGVWDFGGQEIFYATHQFFLSEDALYILVWTAPENARTHRERDQAGLPFRGAEKWRACEYWLESIRLHGRNSPILMVQTHWEVRENRQKPRPEYQDDFYQAECLNFDADTKHGLGELKKTIAQKLDTEIPFFGQEIAESYLTVLEQLEKLRARIPVITRQTFATICEKAEVVEDTREEVLKYLRRAGVVVFFDRDHLRDLIYIDPNWLTKQAYRLINPALGDRGGLIDPTWLNDALPNYTDEQRLQLLELLKNFELIFEDNAGKTPLWVAPQYLPEAPKQGENNLYDMFLDDVSLAFAFRFPRFMPDNVMINFLARYGPFSRKQYWRDAICFTSAEKVKCSVRFREADNCLLVDTDPSEQKSVLQKQICQAFVELSKNANAEISLDGERFVSWQDLLKACDNEAKTIEDAEGGKIEVKAFSQLTGRGEGLMVQKHFDLVDDSQTSPILQTQALDMDTPTRKKIFVSYAHADAEIFKNEIVRHLSSLREQELIDDWNDRKIEPGEWNPQIKKAVEEADIFLLLITPGFLASRYIDSEELAIAYQRYRNGSAKIFPIICEVTPGWELKPVTRTEKQMHPVYNREMFVWLGIFQPYPKDGKAIATWAHRNEAFLDIYNSLLTEVLKTK